MVPGDPDLPMLVLSKALTDIRARFGPRQISFAGGEPLLYGGLVDMIAQCTEEGHSSNVVTNGALLTPRLARDFQHWGLDQYILSLDGFAEQHDALRQPGAWDAAQNGLRNMSEFAASVPLGIICVINRLNAASLLEFTEHVLSMRGVRSLLFQAFISHQAQDRDRDWYLGHPLWPDDLDGLGATLDRLAAWAAKEPRIVNQPSQFGLMKAYFRDPTRFVLSECLSWKRLMIIEASGDVKYCMGTGVIGNLNEQSFSEMWDSDRHREVRGRIASCRIVCHSVINCGFVPESLEGLPK